MSCLNVKWLWNVFNSQFSNMIIMITKLGCILCWRAVGADNRSTTGLILFTCLLLAKLHHGNCLLFTLIYLDCDNRGLTDSRGYDVKEDLGIDFWFTTARPVCFWMRHAGVDLEKKLLDLCILATTGKWSSNCVKGGDRQVCHKYSFTYPPCVLKGIPRCLFIHSWKSYFRFIIPNILSVNISPSILRYIKTYKYI